MSIANGRSNTGSRERGDSAAPPFVDAATLMRIKSLEMRAKVVVEGLHHGLHRSPFHGFSVEFSEYRQYAPGDDLRYLDWRLLARTDRHFVKRFEDETNLRCYLLVDQSRSMDYGSSSYTKAQYAATTAATLGYFLASQRDAVGLLTFDDQVLDYLPSRYRPGHLHHLMMILEKAVSGAATDLRAPLRQIARIATKRGLIVLISDLLAPIESLADHLGYLRVRGHEVIVIRTLDPQEVNFSFNDSSMFHDLESDRELYVDPKAAREQYLERFAKHAKAIQETCDGLGIDFVNWTIDQPLELLLFDFLHARQRRGKTISRRGSLDRRPAGTGRST